MVKHFEKFAGEGINDADYEVTKFKTIGSDGKRIRLWVCPFYEKWMNLMRRTARGGCRKRGCYESVEICEDWLRFSSFKKWMEQQNWQGRSLDKDLIGTGELYSPDTCCFISDGLNTALAGYKTDNLTRLKGVITNKYSYSVGLEKFLNVYDAIDALYEIKIKCAISHTEYDWEVQEVKDYFMKHKLLALKLVNENPDLYQIKSAWKPKEKPVKQLTGAALTPIHRQERLGLEFVNKKGDKYKIIEYFGSKNITVEFETGERKSAQWDKCVKGSVAKPESCND